MKRFESIGSAGGFPPPKSDGQAGAVLPGPRSSRRKSAHFKILLNQSRLTSAATIPSPRSRAFTIWDLLIVLVTLGLALMLLPALTRPKVRVNRINCVSNLKQVGLAFRMWTDDHNEQFPWAVSANEGGSKEYIETGEVFRHFLAASNELNSPKILACSCDSTRTRATNWNVGFNHKNVSYFVGLDADLIQPQTILAGDRNITGGSMVNSNLMLLATNSPAGWSTSMHNGSGNLVFADGSAGQFTPRMLQQQLLAATNAVIRLAIP